MIATTLKHLKENRIGLSILLLAWLIFFSRILFGGQLYFFDDLKIIYYPLEHVYAQFQAGWELPQWSNEFGFGHPLIAWGQLGFFTPLHLILRFFGIHPLILLNISIMTYFLIGLVGMFTFLRVRNFSQPAATLGAALFVFSGFTIGHLQHVNFFTSTMLLPWLLLAAHFLITHPTISRAVLLSLVAAAITVSGQPQVILFTFIIAAIISVALFVQQLRNNPQTQTLEAKPPRFVRGIRIVACTLIAGFLALGLSSFAILPLLEFLPLTERAAGISPDQLYEFSYPPSHAITLIKPYFFGDYDTYWGAKSFQELAAFVGIIPLLLGAVALTRWQKHRPERIAGIILIFASVLIAPGAHSPFYRYLVESHLIEFLTVPSRFIYFFTVGMVFLAALGLDDIANLFRTKFSRPLLYLLVLLGTTVLLTYAWNYNPLSPRTIALQQSPFMATLNEYHTLHSTPARLYSDERPTPLRAPMAKRTDPISPQFTISQPFIAQEANLSCLYVPMATDAHANGTVTFTIREDPKGEPIRTVSISSGDVDNLSDQQICFPSIEDSANKAYWLTISSPNDSRVVLFVRHSDQPDQQVYFIRVPNATVEQFHRSRKTAQLVFSQVYHNDIDKDMAMISRHINAIAGASSARWIGALAIRPYREFIETFFANDSDPIGGDGLHAIQRNRTILNMSGVTHVIQAVPNDEKDTMADNGYEFVKSEQIGSKEARLYYNLEALPKAFMVRNAIWKPAADETRHALLDESYDPLQLVYISGPTPPKELPQHSNESLDASVVITRYDPTQVDVAVTTSEDAILVLTDSWTPQWHTFIDDTPALQLVANSVFKSALVPAGHHTVSFRYASPAIERSRKLTAASLITILILLALSNIKLYGRNPHVE